MRASRSPVGAALAALYALAFAVAYFVYLRNAGQFLADAPIMLVALPYSVASLEIFGSVDLSGDNWRQVATAALFCAALAYAIGAILEAIARAAFRIARAR